MHHKAPSIYFIDMFCIAICHLLFPVSLCGSGRVLVARHVSLLMCVFLCQACLEGDYTNDAEVNEGDAPVLQHEEVACVHVCVKGAAPYDARRPRVECRYQRGLRALYRVGANCVEIDERPISQCI